MKTGNYQIAGGRIHRYITPEIDWFESDYLCGLGTYNPDKRTTKPVTCKHCRKQMGGE